MVILLHLCLHLISCICCTSSLITTGPIYGSHVSTITCTLGWDDGISPTPKVEGETYDSCVEGGVTPKCPNAPT
jgi:hypothetical protein